MQRRGLIPLRMTATKKKKSVLQHVMCSVRQLIMFSACTAYCTKGVLFIRGATKRRFLYAPFHLGSCTAGADRPTAPCMVWFNAGRRESQKEGGWRSGSSSSLWRNTLRGGEKKKRRRHGGFAGAQCFPLRLVSLHKDMSFVRARARE